jgi:hypothetical protein
VHLFEAEATCLRRIAASFLRRIAASFSRRRPVRRGEAPPHAGLIRLWRGVLSRAASSSRGGSLVLPPRPGWRDLAGRCWHARPPAASPPPTNPAPEPASVGELGPWPTSLASPLAPGGLLACHGVHRPPGPRAGQTARPGNRKGQDHDRGSRQLRRQPHRPARGPLHRQRHRPGHVPGGRLWSAGAGAVVLHRGRLAGPGRACRAVAEQGKPGRGGGPAPAAGLDR